MPIGEFQKKSATALLSPSSAQYYIPDNQRTFSWAEDQVDDLMEDIKSTYAEMKTDPAASHFMGLIVLYKDKQDYKSYVYDGQQRMTNLILFFKALSDLYTEIGTQHQIPQHEVFANKIVSKFIYEDASYGLGEDIAYSLSLGKANDSFIKNHIFGKKPIPKKGVTETNKLMYKAYKKYYAGIQEMVKKIEDKEERYTEAITRMFITLQKTVGDGFQFLVVETDDINQAYEIFETLNARGKELETADLLKNHLLMNAKTKYKEMIQENWDTVCNELAIFKMNEVTRYIRYYWNSRFEFARERDLFRKLRKEYQANDINKKKELVEDLARYVTHYRNLIDEDYAGPYTTSNAMRDAVMDLKQLGLYSYIPIILAASNNPIIYSEQDLTRIMNYLLIYIVRNIIIAGQTANRNEILFSSIAKRISQGTLDEVEQIKEELKANDITDAEFILKFSEFATNKKNYIRYLLRKINNAMNGTPLALRSPTEVHIEHIMPQTPMDEEKAKDPKYQSYLWRLGNLTFLLNTDNISISNGEYLQKVDVYQNCDLKITKTISQEFDHWDYETIEERQKKMAEIAKGIWQL